ncbi:MAG TPA: hypothetical protein VF258_05755, partial [Luteolibacter sp.]
HAQLIAEAATLGIALDPNHPSGPVRITKHERENREADAKLAATELIAFAKEMQAHDEKGDAPVEAIQKRIMDLTDRMMSLDTAQLKIVIAQLRASRDLKDDTRQGIIGFAIMTLADDHPQAALALFTESSDLVNEGMSGHVVSSSLAKWAKVDPLAALDWVRKNGEKYPDLVTDDAKRGLIAGAAIQDPKLALSLIGEFGMKSQDSRNAIWGIMSAAKTPEERTVTLGALREHLATLKDEKARSETADSAFRTLAYGVAREGFEAGTQWLENANLTPDELESATRGLNHATKSGETGQWIEWVGAMLPEEKADRKIRDLVNIWTENDYQAAGKWLAATPPGTTKNAAIRSYALIVSRYEPEVAGQWAMTLPAGAEREKTLKGIYDHWPKDDEAAKQAFANEHGIK